MIKFTYYSHIKSAFVVYLLKDIMTYHTVMIQDDMLLWWISLIELE